MTLKFFGAFASQKVKDATRAATDALVAFDPKGATEAQISLMNGQLDQLGQKVATVQRQLGEAQTQLKAAQNLNSTRLTAAETLQTQISGLDATDASRPAKEASLNKLLDIIEQAQPELTRLKAEEAEVQAYLDDLQTAYKAAAEKLSTARDQLKSAERGMERAKIAQDRAQDRAEAASIAAGVHAGGDALNTALDAMRRKTEAATDAANASNLKAATLAPVDHEKDDPNIVAAMQTAAGEPTKPQSAAERLAALRAA